MSGGRVTASTNRNKASVNRSGEHRTFRASKVLAERNPPVVAVGAWVEDGQDFPEHPCALAFLTEKLQAERRRQSEESLRRFQNEVRHRVAQKTQIFRKKQHPQMNQMVNPEMRFPQQQYRIWSQHVPAGERCMSAGAGAEHKLVEGRSQESGEGVRQVRLRLAACQRIVHGEMMPDLPGGKWNISLTKHKVETHVPGGEYDLEAEEDVEVEAEEEGDDQFFNSQHEFPLVRQKVNEHMLWETAKSQSDPGFKPRVKEPQALWPLTDQEKMKRQRQSQFLMQRRLFMSTEREQVKENNQHRKHLNKTARVKAEKERFRQEEERRLETAQQLAEARQKLEERELLILERLKLDEEERVVKLQRRKREEKGKVSARFLEALRAQTKERLSQEKLEPPPLCCCAASFWDSHPDTCANNCVFHNNPKAYAQALQSTVWSHSN